MSDRPVAPSDDPLGHHAVAIYQATYPLLGIPITISSNSELIMAAAERSFGRWRALADELVTPSEPLRVKLLLHPGQASYTARQPFVQRLTLPYYLTACGESIATANLLTGEAVGFVTPELLADDMHVRHNMLECLALLLVTQRDRWPVHAAAVVRNGRALLLVGPSKTGKSTLSYACLRAGWQLLAEDAVYISLESATSPTAWGMPWRIHLLPDAPRHFPELADRTPQIQANGKLKIGIDVSALGADRLRTHVSHMRVCLLTRSNDDQSRAEPIEPSVAVAALTEGLEAGFDLNQRALPVAQALVARQPWRVSVGSDLVRTVELLEGLIDQ